MAGCDSDPTPVEVDPVDTGYLPSRDGKTISDRVAQHVLAWIDPDYVHYSYLDRGRTVVRSLDSLLSV